MSETKPIRLFRGGLSGRVYATRAYREYPNGRVVCTGQKFDVTEQVLALAAEIQGERAEGAGS
jgi:hypothetical protein